MIRAKADWLIGMNASRAYSLVYNARFTVGRVQTPTLAMIVDRDRDITGHVARPYWKVVARWRMEAGRRTTGQAGGRRDAAADRQLGRLRFMILAAGRKQQHDAPPRLYDLTGLQKDMSRLRGLTAARTLAALQSLYEKNWRRIRAPTRSTSRTTTWTRCAASPKATGSPPASSNRPRNRNGHISN